MLWIRICRIRRISWNKHLIRIHDQIEEEKLSTLIENSIFLRFDPDPHSDTYCMYRYSMYKETVYHAVLSQLFQDRNRSQEVFILQIKSSKKLLKCSWLDCLLLILGCRILLFHNTCYVLGQKDNFYELP